MHLTHISKLKATAHSLSISRDADSFCIMHILGLILTQAQIYFFFQLIYCFCTVGHVQCHLVV